MIFTGIVTYLKLQQQKRPAQTERLKTKTKTSFLNEGKSKDSCSGKVRFQD